MLRAEQVKANKYAHMYLGIAMTSDVLGGWYEGTNEHTDFFSVYGWDDKGNKKYVNVSWEQAM